MVAEEFGFAGASGNVCFAQANSCPVSASLHIIGPLQCSSSHPAPTEEETMVAIRDQKADSGIGNTTEITLIADTVHHEAADKRALIWPWAAIPLAPVDPILAIQALLRSDNSGLAVDLCVGAYRNADGEPTELRCITRASERLSCQPRSHGYLPLAGNPELRRLSVELVFGDCIAPASVACIQTISGSGALRLALELCRKQLGATTALVSDPSWPNHAAMAAEVGLHVTHYAYYDRARRGVRAADMLHDLRAAPRGSVAILHACAHNPSGADLTAQQWTQVADAVVERGLLPLFDLAYQGLASGDTDADAGAVRMFVRRGIPVLLSLSFAKSLGLYNSRVGTLQVALPGPGAAAAVKATMSQLVWLARATNSTPPAQGAALAAAVLGDGELRAMWKQELREMTGRMRRMRRRLREALEEAADGAGGVNGEQGGDLDFKFVEEGCGMFVVLGMSEEEVAEMRAKWHVYLAPEGRLNVCGLTERNVDRVARATVAVASAAKSGGGASVEQDS